ncbi:D-ribose pyranase [Tritonibacter horizontis]|uniref:D-ribose pyranase n=1 Tax=Tritonibacter horizontis TaxID=1768241 RepID=A0A132C1W5_9RHOB|nr:D-ribose pyranase [Tritonibacter horizontis]KUP94635.1 D-ribose pyranase [Tritonibacter horizontis]
MKRTPLLNRHLSALIASLGHLDEIVIADAGLPTPRDVPVIDLALVAGTPGFLDVLRALKHELCVEGAILAQEAAPALVAEVQSEMDGWGGPTPIAISRLPHAAFKARTPTARAIIRSGETTPYANIILICGVAF